MMRIISKNVVLFFVITLCSGLFIRDANAQTLQLIAYPPEARIHLLQHDGSLQLIGTGRAKYKLKRRYTNSIVVTAEGYKRAQWDFIRKQKYASSLELVLDTRVIAIAASSDRAKILVNNVQVGTGRADIVVGRDQTVVVEAQMDGFWPASKEYSTLEGANMIPLRDVLEIQDRMIAITVRPVGATVLVDNEEAGTNFAKVRIPQDSCVTVGAAADGFVRKEQVFCNQDSLDPPPTSNIIMLTDRMITVRTLPQTANILVNGRVVSTDEYAVVLREDKCTDVSIEQSGYISQSRRYCNQSGNISLTDHEIIELQVDEAFTGSQASDQANNNIIIEVGEARSYDDAWKLMSLIVLSSFDILEITDKETGYLRTAWAVSRFESSTVRTRIIVKQGDIDPIKFVVKIISEFTPDRDVSTNCDQCFVPWDRLLYQYKDIINEMIFRLR